MIRATLTLDRAPGRREPAGGAVGHRAVDRFAGDEQPVVDGCDRGAYGLGGVDLCAQLAARDGAHDGARSRDVTWTAPATFARSSGW
jgi:hypothetical protein